MDVLCWILLLVAFGFGLVVGAVLLGGLGDIDTWEETSGDERHAPR